MFLKYGKHLFSILFILNTLNITSQNIDSLITDTTKKKLHSPAKAALFSAVIPGLGQVYNKKHLMIPIVYGGLATTFYFAQTNRVQYKFFKEAYIARVLNQPVNPALEEYSTESLELQMNTYRQNMEWSWVGFVAVYLLNVVEANVSAHLKSFDVSDDLSWYIQPNWQSNHNNFSMGLELKLRF